MSEMRSAWVTRNPELLDLLTEPEVVALAEFAVREVQKVPSRTTAVLAVREGTSFLRVERITA